MNHQLALQTSEDLTDLEEEFDSYDEEEYHETDNVHQISDLFAVSRENRSALINPTLQQAKRVLVSRLTKLFWSNFHGYWGPRTFPLVMGGDLGVEQTDVDVRSTEDGILDHQYVSSDHVHSFLVGTDGARSPKRLKAAPSGFDLPDTGLKLACPYRKHDPWKYTVPNYGPCALTPLQTVARVKHVNLRFLVCIAKYFQGPFVPVPSRSPVSAMQDNRRFTRRP